MKKLYSFSAKSLEDVNLYLAAVGVDADAVVSVTVIPSLSDYGPRSDEYLVFYKEDVPE